MVNKHDIKVVVLAGGMGKRLRPVISDRPKILAPVGGKTVLDLIIDNLLCKGFRNISISTGYMKDMVRKHMETRSLPRNIVISFSEENTPLGTGGAIKRALSGHFGPSLVLNGDTFFPIDYDELIRKHHERQADVSISLCNILDSGRYGTVDLDGNNRVLRFKEKNMEKRAGIINGGVYFFGKNVFNEIDFPDEFSIEKDFFAKFVDRLNIYGFTFDDYFVDIGVPEDYERAKNKLGP